jgi:hypothetical protein
MSAQTFRKLPLALAVAAAVSLSLSTNVSAYEVTHTFKIDDIVGGFDGRTYGPDGNYSDPEILCGLEGSPSCPSDGPQPFTDKAGNTLYPVNSDFGFYVVDFALGYQKEKVDPDGETRWEEGFAGNIVSEGQVVGLAVANIDTDTFKVPPPLGTWCAGLGNTSVKCSTEHYAVMEHIKSCHETVPYVWGDDTRADPVTGDQAQLLDPYTGAVLTDCAANKLDNTLTIIGGVYDEDGTLLFPEGTVIESDQILYDGVGGYLLPNESTVLDNIAKSNDFSVTAKDDGKPLYRWGDLIKRPNDLRMYARMALPEEWKTPEAQAANGGLGLRVYYADLYVDHVVTNNPNDQLRPEDMENEGATGRKPGSLNVGFALVSDTDCYEGDGDFIPGGTTWLQNGLFPYDGLDPTAGDPYAWSEDLQEGLSNGWYTTVDREPFEWAYDNDGDGDADVSSPVPDDTLGTLVSGPRWRLTSQKFGQDVPGLEIPVIECSEPPYQKDNIKYEVGAPYTTIINVLDWDPEDERSVTDPDTGELVSPLAFSNGWISDAANEGAVANPDVPVQNADLDAISINGAPLSNDYDLQVYIKGDKKATAIYSATLVVSYEGEDVPPVGNVDVAAVTLNVPDKISAQNPAGRIKPILFTVRNVGLDTTDADAEVCGVAEGSGGVIYEQCFYGSVENLLPGVSHTFEWSWQAPATPLMVVEWTATASAEYDDNADNDTLTDSTIVQPLRK